MNKIEYMVGIVGEEATEVTKACHKANRFGLDDTDPATGLTNRQTIVAELNDLEGAVRLLREVLQEGGTDLVGLGDEGAINAKIDKILHYAKRSIANGTLVEDVRVQAAPSGAA